MSKKIGQTTNDTRQLGWCSRRHPRLYITLAVLAICSLVYSVFTVNRFVDTGRTVRDLELQGATFGYYTSESGYYLSEVVSPVLGDNNRLIWRVSTVRLRGDTVNAENIRVLSQQFPNLRALCITDCELTDEVVEEIANFTQLQNLWFRDAGVTDEDLARFGGMDSLGMLVSFLLAGNDFTENGVASLSELPSLRKLTLLTDNLSMEQLRNHGGIRDEIKIDLYPTDR